MTMIEKVARALHEALGYHDWPAPECTQCASAARAAIEAMRDPLPKMIQAAARGVSDSFHEEGFQEGDDPSLWREFEKAGERAFSNAIDAALKEE